MDAETIGWGRIERGLQSQLGAGAGIPEALGLGVAGARPDDASDRITRPLQYRPASRSRISRNRLAGLTNLKPASGIRGRPLLRGACDSRACPAQ